MDIPHIPTDNLYKFMSIFGLVVLIFFFVVPKIFAYQAMMDAFKVRKSISLLEKESEYLDKKISQRKEELEKNGANSSETKGQLYNILKKHELKLVEQEVALEKMKYIEKVGRSLESLAKKGFIAGSLISSFGFFLWYWYIQRFEDRKLKDQLTSLSSGPRDAAA